MAEMNQLDVSTRQRIRENPALVDSVFNHDPLLAYLKLNVREDWVGGSRIQEGIIFDGGTGGPVGKGQEFDITEKQVEQAMIFDPKVFMSNVTMSLEDIQLFNTGPLAAFRLIDSRLSTAFMTLGAHLAIALYLNGQGNYVKSLNGLAEIVNDNSTASWDNATYSKYGDLTRGGQVGNALNGHVTNVGGAAIEYNVLEESYGDATYGNDEPNIGITTVKGYSYIKEKFQTQQRFNDTQDPKIGFNGLKFNSSVLMKSRYCPGSDIATSGSDSNKIAVTMLKTMSNGAIAAYPTLANSASETLFWLNARKPYLNLYVSSDALFGFGFTGFKPAQGNFKVAGQVAAGLNITGAPRYHAQVHGFNG